MNESFREVPETHPVHLLQRIIGRLIATDKSLSTDEHVSLLVRQGSRIFWCFFQSKLVLTLFHGEPCVMIHIFARPKRWHQESLRAMVDKRYVAP